METTSKLRSDAAKQTVRGQFKLEGAVAGLMFALLILMAGSSRAANGTWTGRGSQAYGQAIWGGVANWVGNTVADGAGNTATFGNSFTNGYSCIVNTARTIGNITYTDPVNANDMVLAKHASDYTLTLNNSGASPVINVTQSGRTLTINPRIAGTAGLTKNGPGALTLNTNNTYSGNTIISAGTLTLGHSLAMQNSVLDTANSIPGDAANGLKTTVTTLTLGGLSGDKDLSSVFTTTTGGYGSVTALTLNPGAGVNLSYSGTIADGATGMSLTKTGAGIQTLSGTNTFSGPATVNSGTLGISVGSLSGPVIVNAGGTLSLTSDGSVNTATVNTGGNISLPGTGLATGLAFANTGSMSFDVANGGLLLVTAVNGVTNNGAAGSITINIAGSAPADGTYTLIAYSGSLQGSGFSAYQLGATPVGKAYTLVNTAGAVQLVVATPLYWTGAQSSEWSTNSIGGLMNWSYAASPADYANGLGVLFDDSVGGGSTTVDISVANVTPANVAFQNSAYNYTLQGSMAITGATVLTKNGSGTLTILNRNTYTGPTLINEGVVQVGSGATNGTLGSGAILDNGALQFNRSDALAVASPISGTGTLEQNGNGTLTLSGANTYGGATTINAGTLRLGAADVIPDGTGKGNVTLNGTLDLNTFSDTINGLNGAGTVDTVAGGMPTLTVGGNNASSTFSGVIRNTSGSLALAKTGTGTLTLSGTNSFSGGITHGGGIISVADSSALGSGTVTFNGGTRLVVATGLAVTNPIILGTNVGVTGRGLLEAGTTAGTSVISGPITINNGASAGGLFAAPTANTILNVAGPITSSVPVSSRIGTVMFSGGGTGYTNLSNNQGTTKVGANDGIATTATVNLAASGAGTLDLNGFNQSVVGITKGANAATIGNSSTTSDSMLTITGTSTFGGTIQDTVDSGTMKVNLTVNGGALTLAGTNTYTGTTTVSNGTLLVNGAIGIGAVTVAAGGTLGGTGTIAGLVQVAAGGTLSPGVGTNASRLSVSQLTLQTGATVAIKLNGTNNGAYDQIASTWNVNLGFGESALALTLGYTPAIGDQYSIFNMDPTIALDGFFAGLLPDATFVADGYRFQIQYWIGDGNDVVLTCLGPVNSAPEIVRAGPLSGTAFPLTFSGTSGQSYQVLTSTNVALPLTNWTVLTNGAFGASPATYMDTSATNAQQYYRIKSP